MLVLDPALVVKARKLLDRARVIAEAPAGQPGQIGRSHPSGRAPPGAFSHEPSTLDRLGGRLVAVIASNDQAALVAWVKWATDELDVLQHGPSEREETVEMFRFRIVTDYEGIPTAVVARRELSTEPVVRKIRQQAGLDSKGRKTAGEGEDS